MRVGRTIPKKDCFHFTGQPIEEVQEWIRRRASGTYFSPEQLFSQGGTSFLYRLQYRPAATVVVNFTDHSETPDVCLYLIRYTDYMVCLDCTPDVRLFERTLARSTGL